MGIGVVDPILPILGRKMGATPVQIEWMFTAYLAIMAVAMLLSGVVGTRLGSKLTMLLGLGLVVVFATASGLSPSIGVLALFRGGWGLGNAFFTSTALSLIVGLSAGRTGAAITLYEAALGLGIASGPLLGGLLGSASWRYPFFGTAVLMAVGFLLTVFFVSEPSRREQPRTARDIFRALRHRAVLTNALIGLSYSYAFFTILAYSPLTLPHISALALGVTYFAWGILVAISSVFIVNALTRRLRSVTVLIVNLSLLVLLLLAAGFASPSELLILIVISGLFCGIANALFTTLAMEVSPFPRSISSGAYNFLRWSGAAIAPALSGWIGQTTRMTVPFFISGGIVAIGILVLSVRGSSLQRAMQEQSAQGAN